MFKLLTPNLFGLEKIDFSLIDPPLMDVTVEFTNVSMAGLSDSIVDYVRANKEEK